MTAAPIFTVHIQLGAPIDIGAVAGGFRRVILILGGRVEGEAINGRVLESGADWQLIKPEGHIDLDARYVLETEQGEHIYISNIGRRILTPEACADLVAGKPVDQSRATSRGLTTMESGAPRLRWLNDEKFRPRGKRGPNGIEIGFYRLDASDAGEHPWA
ncbi:MAG: DUF3237 domain-containing protein [Pseudomonadota bacterium]